MLYIMNALVIPPQQDEALVKLRKISLQEARALASKEPFISAVGHEATAKLLSRLLGVDIPMNRIAVFLAPEDKAIHLVLKVRLAEGQILSEEELQDMLDRNLIELWLSEVLQ